MVGTQKTEDCEVRVTEGKNYGQETRVASIPNQKMYLSKLFLISGYQPWRNRFT